MNRFLSLEILMNYSFTKIVLYIEFYIVCAEINCFRWARAKGEKRFLIIINFLIPPLQLVVHKSCNIIDTIFTTKLYRTGRVDTIYSGFIHHASLHRRGNVYNDDSSFKRVFGELFWRSPKPFLLKEDAYKWNSIRFISGIRSLWLSLKGVGQRKIVQKTYYGRNGWLLMTKAKATDSKYFHAVTQYEMIW